MTQEQKQLLLRDLCARLPYGVIVHRDDYWDKDYPRPNIVLTTHHLSQYEKDLERWNIKPYLRPMSSMTEEEQRTLDSMCNGVEMVSRLSGLKMFDKAFDWLDKHHFDYRGLISMGLALEAPKGMYKTK